MRTFGKILLALLVVTALAAPAVAATKEGDKEISAAVSISSTSASADDVTADVTTTSIYGAFGVFLNKQLQVGASILSQTASTEDADAGVTFTEGFVKFHFNPDEKAVPYVGALFGLVTLYSGDEAGSGTTFGAMAGVKYFATADLSINGEYSIRYYEVSIAGIDFSSTTSTMLVGLSYYFR
jgi:hypothetical protein